MTLELVKSSVRPSGFAVFTARAARDPFAPGRFSMTTFAPVSLCISSARSRATRSTTPPAEKGTNIRIFDGKVCAKIGAPEQASMQIETVVIKNVREVVAFLFTFELLDPNLPSIGMPALLCCRTTYPALFSRHGSKMRTRYLACNVPAY